MNRTDRVEPRQALCDALARRLHADGGLASARLLQFAGLLGPELTESVPAGGALPADVAAALMRQFLGDTPAAIGLWQPVKENGALRFERNRAAPNQEWWPPHDVLRAKRSLLPLRVCLLGESTAAGWFYAPAMTPAKALTRHLDALRPGLFEVLDLTQVNLQPSGLAELFCAALQLTPDVVVLFAGNNWPMRLPAYPGARLADAQSAALALRESGVHGLMAWSEGRTRRAAEHTVAVIGAIAEARGVPVVVVVPEVNLADWSRQRPAPWLAADRTRRWHALHERAVHLLATARYLDALEAAEQMLELDAGVSATTHGLLARALSGLQRWQDARTAQRHAVDARAWDNFPSMPSATSAVQAALRAATGTHGFGLVDLPQVFAEHSGDQPPGRHLFLDYCHLTLEGIHVAMAATAAEVLAQAEPQSRETLDWRFVAGNVALPAVELELEAAVCFMTALYNAHYGAGLDVFTGAQMSQKDSVVSHWLNAAQPAEPAIVGTMVAYARTRAVPRDALQLSAALQAFHQAIGVLARQSTYNETLDPELVGAIDSISPMHGTELRAAFLAHHAPRDAPIDLAQPLYHWNVIDRYEDRTGFGYERCAYYRARWPVSHFCLVSDGSTDLTLELCARLPGGSEAPQPVEMQVNGAGVGQTLLAPTWTKGRIRLGRDVLRSGFNRVTLRWPAPAIDGDAVLAAIRESLELGVPTELHPVFGEVYALIARTTHNN